MSEGTIDVRSSDGITVVTIQRPDKRNAMTAAMCEQLRAAWETFRDGDDRAAILTGSGNFFCAGADLTSPPSQFWRALPDLGLDVGKPVITALNGPAIGLGVGLVAFSDLCVAATTARFVYPEARVGVALGLMGSIAARIPHKVALELLLLGEPLEAQRAYEVGLVNRVCDPDDVMDEAMRMARILASSAPRVLRMLKRMVRDTLPRSPVESMFLAQAEVDHVMHSEDAAEGLAAFREKRAPRFTGR